MARSAKLGEKLKGSLEELLEHPFIGDIRVLRFWFGIEIVENKKTKQSASAKRMAKLINGCKKKGRIVGKNGDTVEGYNNVLTLSLPLSCTDEDVNFVISILKKVFAEQRN